MKTKTTTREYDKKGNMVRETVVEREDNTTSAKCTCIEGNGWIGYHWCPRHGQQAAPEYTVSTTSHTTPKYSGAAIVGEKGPEPRVSGIVR